jgi:hypothetical protein
MNKTKSMIVVSSIGFLYILLILFQFPFLNHLIDITRGNSSQIVSILYSICLSLIVILLSGGLGKAIIWKAKFGTLTSIEENLISVVLGLGCIAYAVLLLGLIGFLTSISLILLLGIIGGLTYKTAMAFGMEILETAIRSKQIWRSFRIIEKILFIIGGMVLILAFIQALTPPWHYDGLSYHLSGPRQFIQDARILPDYNNWFTFYPSTWEMLYTLGLGLKSEVFSHLMHFSAFLFLLAVTYTFGRRYLPKPGGWLAALLLLAIPIMPLWASAAYTDITWALYQFIAITFIVKWTDGREKGYLILAGIMQGFALGSKYLAFSGFLILIMIIIWKSFEHTQSKWKSIIFNGFLFSISALLVCSPWYIKNLIWTGNPVFPLILPQEKINPQQIAIWMDYVRSFGTGFRWQDYLMLPINLFIRHDAFGSFMGTMEMPNPLYLLAFLYPIFRRNLLVSVRNIVDSLAIITALQFMAWAIGSQQNRFLLPLFPGLSILTSFILLSISTKFRFQHIGRSLVIGSAGGMLLVTLIFMGIYINLVRPDRVISGIESKVHFLQRMVRDYSGIEFINDHLPNSSRVLMLWDARGYYCENRCIPDTDQSKWVTMVADHPDILDMANILKEEKITHLFFSKDDASFFILKHDPQKIHLNAAKFLLDEFVPACTINSYEDEWSAVYELLPSCK